MELDATEERDDRLKRRIMKFKRERMHFEYLISKGFYPIDIADRLIHNMLTAMKIGLENKHPGSTPEEIRLYMKERNY